MFLNIYSKIDKGNEDFNNVYDWFVNANYLDLGNPRFEDFINTRISLKILSDEKYKKEFKDGQASERNPMTKVYKNNQLKFLGLYMRLVNNFYFS